MSLDVYLKAKYHVSHDNKETFEEKEDYVYDRNITHNLNKMAIESGLYYALWRPEEINLSTAEQLIPYLEKGIKKLKSKPDYYKQFNSENGWGVYENLVEFTESYLEACKEYPKALIEISR